MANLSLLLVGRTGNGKSSTGNSILGEKPFTPKGSTAALSNDIKSGNSVVEGKSVAVVDGPGLGDGSFDSQRDVDSAISLCRKALTMVAVGFHAILIVLKYGVRFTQQEKDAITWIKSIFGESVIRNHGVVVLTHGDSFELDTEDEDTTFDQWCKDQTGDVQALFKECKQRRVMFNNRTKDGAVMKRQVIELFSKVQEIQSGQKPYTMEDFNRAESGRIRLLIRAKLPQFQKETEDLLDKIDRELQKLDDNRFSSPQSQLQELEQIKAKVEKHKNNLRNEDGGTGTLESLLLQISVSESTIKSRIDRCSRQIEQETLQRDMQRHSEKFRDSRLGQPAVSVNVQGQDQYVKKIVSGVVLLLLGLFYLYWNHSGTSA